MPCLRIFVTITIVFLFLSLGKTAEVDVWKKRMWVEKVSRSLRAGQGLTDADNPEVLLKKDESQIVDYFLEDPLFAETVLDFGLYFAGFRQDRVRLRNQNFNPSIFLYPQAIAAAKEVAHGGNFFTLLKFDQPMFMEPLATLTAKTPAERKFKSQSELRDFRFEQLQHSVDRAIKLAQKEPVNSSSAVCKYVKEQFGQHYRELRSIGIDQNIIVWLKNEGWWRDLYDACTVLPSGFDAVVELQQIKKINALFYEQLRTYAPDSYGPKALSEINPIDFKKIGFPGTWSVFNPDLVYWLPSSVTNNNRRRAAYVLSRYFCDELTPIDFLPAGEKAVGLHATETTCQACHYKLDPMAGYLKDLGRHFKNYSKYTNISFDDQLSTNREKYQAAWKMPQGSARAWNIGYIRSANNEKLNDYGETVEDLEALIARAPEVKRCMTKRLLSYFTSEEQKFDDGFELQLSQDVTEKSKTNSTLALKSVVKKIILSRTYSEPLPSVNTCYDLDVSSVSTQSLPCEVRYTLEKNCVQCHSSQMDSGRLDLSQWHGDGSDGGFSYYSGDGKKLSNRDSLNAILESITTSDAKKAMPYKRELSTADRERIFLWIDQKLKQVGKESK